MVRKLEDKFYPVEPFNDFREMLLNSRQKWGAHPAFMEKVDNEWRSTTFNKLFYSVMSLGCGLRTLGLRRQMNVAFSSENRIRWAISYLAVACGNAVCVPIDKELKSQEFFHILYTTQTEIFIGSQKYVDMVLEMANTLPRLRHIINMDDRAENTMVLKFSDVLREGSQLLDKDASDYPFTVIEPELPSCILFTSGTTGTSKGVMLSQNNIISDLRSILRVIPIRHPDVFLSVLPLHHTYECTCGFLGPISHGMTVAFAENLKRIPENLQEVHATILLGVPLLWDAIYRKIMERIAEKGMTKFRIGKGLASLSEGLFHKNIRRKVFKPLHERFGGRLRLLISGGAAISPDITRGLRELGLTVIQGYGLTETSPASTASTISRMTPPACPCRRPNSRSMPARSASAAPW